jgi:ATP-binding cassette subfamily C (CFTR/MRP) protein 1
MTMNSVERLSYYKTELEQESAAIVENNRPPASWPDAGHIEFKQVEMRYRPELPLVLKGVNMDIKPGSRVGIVGRTGAGKSTIMTCLFRMTELAGGSIVIDGMDISKMGLDDLRQRLSMIPQEATLFSGTVRYNLDPFNQYTDADLWDALGRCGGDLKELISDSPEKLEYQVSENGDNFSVGQRQLLCLARAMLRRSKILLLDEASASVDYATDDFIQQTLRTDPRFTGCTIVTIAHRLNTIADYDLIFCMADGQIVEFGHPSDLVKMPNGVFRSMIMETGEANANALIQTATLARRSRATGS